MLRKACLVEWLVGAAVFIFVGCLLRTSPGSQSPGIEVSGSEGARVTVYELQGRFDEHLGWWEFSMSEHDFRATNASLDHIRLNIRCLPSMADRFLWANTSSGSDDGRKRPYRTHLGKVFRIDVNGQDPTRLFRIEPNVEVIHILCDDPKDITLTAAFASKQRHIEAFATIPYLLFTFPF